MADGAIDPACRRSIPTIWDGFTRATGLARLFPQSRSLAGYNLTYLPERGSYIVGAVNGAFMMMPRRVLEQVGSFDEQFFMYGEDLDLCHRCERAGFAVVYDGRHSIVHLKGRSSSKNYRVWSEQLFISTEQFFQKHFNPRNSWWIGLRYRVLLRLWYRMSRFLARRRGHTLARPL